MFPTLLRSEILSNTIICPFRQSNRRNSTRSSHKSDRRYGGTTTNFLPEHRNNPREESQLQQTGRKTICDASKTRISPRRNQRSNLQSPKNCSPQRRRKIPLAASAPAYASNNHAAKRKTQTRERAGNCSRCVHD